MTTGSIEVEEQDDVAICIIGKEKLFDEEDASYLESVLDELYRVYEYRKFTLVMDSVKCVTSPSIGKLIRLANRLKEENTKLVVCGVMPEVGEVLTLVKLDELFLILPTREDADAYWLASTTK